MSALNLPYRVVLASASPRRQELLRQIVPEFQVAIADLDEDAHTLDDPAETAELLATLKARHIAIEHPDAIVIGGDTVVALLTDTGWQHLAKPADAKAAEAMLATLSGREHWVITGICLTWPEGESVFSDATRVRFRTLEEEEIRAYVATGEPMDKAGAYAIQGGAAGFVEQTSGDTSTVIGLPVEALEAKLDELFGSDANDSTSVKSISSE